MTPHRPRLWTFLIAAVARSERRKKPVLSRLRSHHSVTLIDGQEISLKGTTVLWYRKSLRRRIRGAAFGLFALLALAGSLPVYLADTSNTSEQGWFAVAGIFGIAALHQLFRGLPLSLTDTPDEALVRTRDGGYVVKEWGTGPQTPIREALRLRPPTQIVWYLVSDFDAYWWLHGHSKRAARRAFPEPPACNPTPRPRRMGFGIRSDG
jgi:hypothetical protein